MANQITDTLERPALYYPYIHIRSEHWLKATLLCVPSVRRIVPSEYTPEDKPRIARYLGIVGPNGPLLEGVPAVSSAADNAQQRFLDKLQENRATIARKYKRVKAPRRDEYWIHVDKFNRDLLNYLTRQQLAWSSQHAQPYGHRSWYALHPILGSAVMTTLGLSIARELSFDIVTPTGRFHEALLANKEEAIFDALLKTGGPPADTSNIQVRNDLTQAVITLAVNLEALEPEDIPELQASNHFRKFQRLIRAAARTIDRDATPDAYKAQLTHEAEEIVEAWHDAQKEVSKKVREILVQSFALSARVFKFAKKPDFAELAILGPLALGVIRSGRGLIDNLRHGDPYHYLSQLKRAENEFLRLTFPLGLER